jgi:hypothetical protein
MNWFVSFLLVILRPALGLIILAGLLLYWVLKKKLPKEKFLKSFFYIFSSVIILQSIFSTILNWWIWSQQGITQRLLPPHSPINYVLKYSWQHYWFESIVTVVTAAIVFFGIYFLNKKFEKNLFYNEEKYLAALGILATGWPNCLIFLCLVLFLGVIFHLIFLCFNANKVRRRGDTVEKTIAISVFSKQFSSPSRLSLLYFWLPCALLILLLGDIISKYIVVNQFII